jgi:hypothetical protein
LEAGYGDFGQVRTDPDLEFVRSDSRFEVRTSGVLRMAGQGRAVSCIARPSALRVDATPRRHTHTHTHQPAQGLMERFEGTASSGFLSGFNLGGLFKK